MPVLYQNGSSESSQISKYPKVTFFLILLCGFIEQGIEARQNDLFPCLVVPNGRKEEYFPIYVGFSDTASIVGNLNFRLPKGY